VVAARTQNAGIPEEVRNVVARKASEATGKLAHVSFLQPTLCAINRDLVCLLFL